MRMIEVRVYLLLFALSFYVTVVFLDLNASGDWKDLAAIEEKINKLGFGLFLVIRYSLLNCL